MEELQHCERLRTTGSEPFRDSTQHSVQEGWDKNSWMARLAEANGKATQCQAHLLLVETPD